MVRRSVCRYPHPLLRTIAEPVADFDDALRSDIDDLIETMYSSPATIGLAAPQIGISKRIFVTDVSGKDPTCELCVFVNPTIIHRSGKRNVREGCLSLPDFTGNVIRAEKIVMKGFDRQGKALERVANGLEAVCWQHELDHLDGMLFIHRVNSIKTDVFRRKRYRTS